MASDVRRLNQAMTLVALLGAAVVVVLLVIGNDWRLILLPIVVTGIVLLFLGLARTSRPAREPLPEPPKRQRSELRVDRIDRTTRRVRRPAEPTPLRPPPPRHEPPSPRTPA